MSEDYTTYTMRVILTAPTDMVETETMIYTAMRTMQRADVVYVQLTFYVDDCDNEVHGEERTIYIKPWAPVNS